MDDRAMEGEEEGGGRSEKDERKGKADRAVLTIGQTTGDRSRTG